jgi:hypothetical protein
MESFQIEGPLSVSLSNEVARTRELLHDSFAYLVYAVVALRIAATLRRA